MIKLKYEPNSLNKEEIARLVAAQLNWPKWDFLPYMPNEGRDDFWTVDTGNNWKLKFIVENPGEMWIYHRYEKCEEIARQVNTLGEWLVVKFGFKKIVD